MKIPIAGDESRATGRQRAFLRGHRRLQRGADLPGINGDASCTVGLDQHPCLEHVLGL